METTFDYLRTYVRILGAVLIADLVALGLAILLGLLRYQRAELDGVGDGVVYAATIGLGFALVSNLFAYVQAERSGLSALSVTASSTASNPNKVVNLIIGFIATDEVSLKGSPTVSPMTVASCRGVPFCFRSTSTTFLALSHAPPAFAIKIAWYKPKIASENR